MKPKSGRPSLAEYLLVARTDKDLTQKAASKEANDLAKEKHLSVTVSQGLIAQYESDGEDDAKIKHPSAAVLKLLAQVYEKDYQEMVMHLLYSHYDVEEVVGADLAEGRWLVWKAALKRFGRIAEVEGLEIDQLRSKARVVAEEQILDIDGIAKWEEVFWDDLPKEHKKFWFVGPSPIADRDPRIQSAVANMIQQDVEITYFIHQDQAAERRLSYLRRELVENAHVPQRIVEDKIKEISLSGEDLRLTSTDVVIAMPSRPTHAVGFANVKQDGRVAYCLRLSPAITERLAVQLNRIRERQMTQLKGTEMLDVAGGASSFAERRKRPERKRR